MPRDGGGIYSKVPGTEGVPGQAIMSDDYNSQVDDLVNDANDERPITAGGTGAPDAATALVNLGGQPVDADLTAIGTLGFSARSMMVKSAANTWELVPSLAYGEALLNTVSEAAFKALVNLEIGVDVQAYDADLATWAGITPGSNWSAALAAALNANVATFLATPTSANLKAAITDETGSGGSLVFATSPSLTTPTIAGATLSGTLGGTPSASGDWLWAGGAKIQLDVHGAGSTGYAYLQSSTSSPYDYLDVVAQGPAGGWSSGIRFRTNNNAGSLTTQLQILNNAGTPYIEVANGTFHGRATISSETSGTISAASANKQINATGDITFNDGVFTAGDRGEIYAGASSRSIVQDTGMTLRLDGTSTTGNRTLAARGRLSWYCVSSTEIVVSGTGVT